MCGIFAYVGHRPAQPVLVEGLKRLEYRGYDSAGVATLQGQRLHLRKCAGRVADLDRHLDQQPAPGSQGIGHTRWATHGPATDVNAHPHVGGDGQVVVAHNGVIENYAPLRRQLQERGVAFQSDTDTEVIAHLIAHHLNGDLVAAVREAVAELEGTYALAVQTPRQPGLLVGTCRGAPLVIGLGQDEHFLASDPGALAGCAGEAVYLQDHQICALRADRWDLLAPCNGPAVAHIRHLDGDVEAAGLGDFEHYMLKEIYEQPAALANTLGGRLDGPEVFPELATHGVDVSRAGRLLLTGCGTSYHAALIGKYVIEQLARVPVEVEYASEFRYRDAPLDRSAVVLAISQSGETADTLAALREAKARGYATLAVCNVPGSSIAREADALLPLKAGPEIGVASTKAFTCQVTMLALLAVSLARSRQLENGCRQTRTRDLRALPDAVLRALDCRDAVRRVAERYHRAESFLYLGRQYLYPVALEGALKLKEVSYVHAEGYPAAELKHGPLALVDDQTPSVVLCSGGPIFAKVLSNLEEIKARRGPVIAVVCEGQEADVRADEVITVPAVADHLQPLVTMVPLQLLAYETALLRGCDVDKPRNLAKSVTVE
jgi:glucosamine--fructose-6-phosphate aminotransferase (isomerizing)